MDQEEIKERIEHRDALLNIRAVITTSSGRAFIKYLIKHLEVAELPDFGLEGDLLREKLGFLRAGQSIFKLISEASHMTAGSILAEVEKEKYERLYVLAQQEDNGRSDGV